MNGRITPASTLDKTHAPSTAPKTPATPRRATSRQSTLRCHRCEPADPAVVKISAVCTSALACAGGMPIDSIAVVEITPNATPSAPSTSCAAKPIAPSNRYSGSTEGLQRRQLIERRFLRRGQRVIVTCSVVAQFALAIELDAKDHYDTAIDSNRGLE